MVKTLLRGLAAASMLSVCGAAHANLLVNGNFTTGDLSGWSASGNVGVYSELDYSMCCSTLHYTPGVYNAGFGAGNVPDNGVLSQSFPTSVGTNYTVSFDYGAVVDPDAQSVNVSIVSGVSSINANVTAFGTNDFDTLFSAHSYSFTAGATTTTLTFTDTSTITFDVDALLSQVSAVATPRSNVPEPTSLAILGIGLVGLGVRRSVRSGAMGA